LIDLSFFVTKHAFDRQTDGQTDRQTDRRRDRILIARPCLHSMQRGKKVTSNAWYFVIVTCYVSEYVTRYNYSLL